MSLAEIIRDVKLLPRSEQEQLKEVLEGELAETPPVPTEEELIALGFIPGRVYEICTPEFEPGASEIMREFMAEHSRQATGEK